MADIVKATGTEVTLTSEMMSGPTGGESLSGVDMTIPRVSLVQSLSEAATRADNKVDAGNWYNELTNENYGKEISVIVIDSIAGYMLFDDSNPPAILATRWKSPKLKSYNAEQITDEAIETRTFAKGVKNKLQDVYCYQVIVNGKDLCLITLKGAACKAARNLNTLLMTKKAIVDGQMKHVPFYAQQFKFTAKFISDGQKKYYEPVIRPDGLTSPGLLQALYLQAQELATKTVPTNSEDKGE